MISPVIGIYGGTFDPVHLGHISAADCVHKAFGLDVVKMVMSANPPHNKQPTLSAKERFELLALAVKDKPYLQANDCEMLRQGPSYMVDTLRYFRQEEPGAALVLILGMEAFNSLMSWYRWEDIIDLAHIVVTNRAGFVNKLDSALEDYVERYLTSDKASLKQQTHGKIYYQPVDADGISSTDIRQRILDDKPIQHMLLPACWNMIQKSDFYT